jgi:hypothetical protein
VAYRGELLRAQSLEELELERDAELKWQTQIGMGWFECNDVRVNLWLLNTDSAEQFGSLRPASPPRAAKISYSSWISRSAAGAGVLKCQVPRSHSSRTNTPPRLTNRR